MVHEKLLPQQAGKTQNPDRLNMDKNLSAPLLEFPKELAVIKIEKPAYVTIQKLIPGQPASLILTHLNLKLPDLKDKRFIKFNIQEIPHIDNQLEQLKKAKRHLMLEKEIQIRTITDQIVWPNDVKYLPEKYFGKKGFLVASGFFPTMFSTGGVHFIEHDPSKKEKSPAVVHKLTRNRKNWFYVRTQPIGMENGKMDILTCRTYRTGNEFIKNHMALDTALLGYKFNIDWLKQWEDTGKHGGELVLLKNPGSLDKPWEEKILLKGPDINFAVKDIDGDGKDEIVCAKFGEKQISVIWEENGHYKERIIEKHIGSAFDVDISDINGDGKLEILATNRVRKNGGVYVYEIPKDFKKDEKAVFVRHELYSGMEAITQGSHGGAPGKAIPFKPHKMYQGKPYILVAGQSSGSTVLLKPTSNDPNRWEYSSKVITQGKSTVNPIVTGDISEDGYTKIFIPEFESGQIRVMDFKPQKQWWQK